MEKWVDFVLRMDKKKLHSKSVLNVKSITSDTSYTTLVSTMPFDN